LLKQTSAARSPRSFDPRHPCLPPRRSLDGRIRRQPEEIIPEYLTGTHEILNTVPDVPVIILRIDGLGKFQDAKYDGFWSFVGRKNGRRHVSLEIEPYDKLDPSMPLADFNKHLEDVLNGPKV